MARTVGLSSLPTADRLPFEGWFLKVGNNGSGPLFGASLHLGQFTRPGGARMTVEEVSSLAPRPGSRRAHHGRDAAAKWSRRPSKGPPPARAREP